MNILYELNQSVEELTQQMEKLVASNDETIISEKEVELEAEKVAKLDEFKEEIAEKERVRNFRIAIRNKGVE